MTYQETSAVVNNPRSLNRRHVIAGCCISGVMPFVLSHAVGARMMNNVKFISTILFGQTPAETIRAIGGAGFSGVEFWDDNLPEINGGTASARKLLADASLSIIDYQLLADFDGAPDGERNAKRHQAITLMDRAVEMGASTLAVTASTDAACDHSRVRDDLVWLIDEARKRSLRLAYEPMSWSVSHATLPSAWSTVRTLDTRVIGLVVDSYHIFSRGRSARDLEGIPAAAISVVQIGDAVGPIAPADYREVARTQRLLPGEGTFPLRSLIDALVAMRYGGPIGIEVFNKDLAKAAPGPLAQEAMRSLNALLEGR